MRFASAATAFGIAVATALLAPPNSADALEFRKCGIDAVISGVGIPTTSVPGSNFVGWARARDGSAAADRIENIAKACLTVALREDRGRIPAACENRERLLNHPRRPPGGALTAFQLTNGLSALKEAVCSNPNIGINYQRSATDILYDKRIIQGFRVSFRKLSGNGGCRGESLFPTSEVTVVCKAANDMLAFERFPARLYRASPSWPQPDGCKAAFSVRGRGDNTNAARQMAREGWKSHVARNHGPGFSDPVKAADTDFKCVRKLQGAFKAECILSARPCYY